jgi:hypothetical protein
MALKFDVDDIIKILGEICKNKKIPEKMVQFIKENA